MPGGGTPSRRQQAARRREGQSAGASAIGLRACATERGGPKPPYLARFANLSLIDSISYASRYRTGQGSCSRLSCYVECAQLLQPAVCCNQASMEASTRPASKAAAKRVWAPGDKQNKPKEETATASASASAETEAKETEKKATDTVSDESRRLWADEPVDPRSVGEDIDLGTLTAEQLPELRRRAAVAKEEHERAMAKKREEHAAQQQATL